MSPTTSSPKQYWGILLLVWAFERPERTFETPPKKLVVPVEADQNSKGRLDSPAVASRVSRARCGQAFAPTPTPSRGGCQTCVEHSHVFRGFRGETELTPDEHTPGRHGLARQSQLGSGEPRRLRRASAARGSRSTGRSPRLLLRRDTVSRTKTFY